MKPISSLSTGKVAVLFVLTSFALQLLSNIGIFPVGAAPVAFIGLLVWLFHERSKHKAYARQTGWSKVCDIVRNNLDHLTRRRAQLARRDTYGKPILDKWFMEMDYFIDHHVFPALSEQEQRSLMHTREQIVGMITQQTFLRLKEEPAIKGFSETMTPFEFESFCAEQLQRAGWEAQVTTQSRDQGVDVIAQKAGKRVVLQCKLYSAPVGNSAVQEIAAGRAHERADHAAVVTNSRYTAPAEQLAHTNKILLLHYRDLSKLDDMLSAA